MADAPLKVYGLKLSPFVRSVVAYLDIHEIPYEFVNIDLMKGEHKSEENLRMNPQGTVPWISHGDYSLGESYAILYYLAQAFGIEDSWVPADPQEKARVYAFSHWSQNNVKVGTYVLRAVVGPKFFGQTYTEEEVAQARNDAVNSLQKFETTLASGKFIAGTSELSIADLAAGSIVRHIGMTKFDLSGFPAIQAWLARLGEIPGFAIAHQELEKFMESLN